MSNPSLVVWLSLVCRVQSGDWAKVAKVMKYKLGRVLMPGDVLIFVWESHS